MAGIKEDKSAALPTSLRAYTIRPISIPAIALK
jgi:hypothetical protein